MTAMEQAISRRVEKRAKAMEETMTRALCAAADEFDFHVHSNDLAAMLLRNERGESLWKSFKRAHEERLCEEILATLDADERAEGAA